MINILISHSQSSTVGLQMMAITWIREFVSLAGSEMLPFTSGILTSVLPCLAYDDEERRLVREKSRAVNAAQMNLVKKENEARSPLRLWPRTNQSFTVSSTNSKI